MRTHKHVDPTPAVRRAKPGSSDISHDEEGASLDIAKVATIRIPRWASMFVLLPISIASFVLIIVLVTMFGLFLFAPDQLSDRFTRAAPGIHSMFEVTLKADGQVYTFGSSYLFFVPTNTGGSSTTPAGISEIEKWLALKAGGFTRWSVNGGVERDATATDYLSYDGYFFLVSVRNDSLGKPRITKTEIETILEQKCGKGAPTYVVTLR